MVSRLVVHSGCSWPSGSSSVSYIRESGSCEHLHLHHQHPETVDEVGTPLRPINEAFAYSLAVITLQRPEPRPLTVAAKFTVLLEAILGSIQAALFVLAVRRRFMR